MEPKSENESGKKTYDQLSDPEKVQAILGAVGKPVSKDMALDFSNVQYSDLDEDAKKEVDSVFQAENLEIREVDGEKRYWLTEEAKAQLGENVDMKSVHQVIADNLSKDLGL